MTIKAIEKYIQTMLIGKTITNVRYITKAEMNSIGLHKRGIVIILDDGTHLRPVSDDEGNESGAVHTSREDIRIIPTF